MRFIIFTSAIIIAAAIDLEYCESHKLALYFVGGVSFTWDIIEILSSGK